MKTKKALIITSIFQIFFCNGCLGTIIGYAFARYYHTGIFLTLSRLGAFMLLLNPTGLICFLACLFTYLKERTVPEEREAVGKSYKWIWIWLVITTVFYAGSLAALHIIAQQF